ncbi:Protein CBG27186 [Caenorhabditis briggsae]|uniref:Protein CBG27186 n=1 Tax=Caenorhabditis briggsae TaxID=6238 RepID=B6IL16_CAEBR|nr:Protein CBG27186 [Caenorhabditis briggsae]CAS00649.1 Protein CBG27186 [Caenorhabditis briggsae]
MVFVDLYCISNHFLCI